jgi:hypothetical protein
MIVGKKGRSTPLNGDLREALRAREVFALSSALHISSLRIPAANQPFIPPDGAFIERILFPYLVYGTVIVEDLNLYLDEADKESESDDLAKLLHHARQRRVVIDTNDVFSEAELKSYKNAAERDLTFEANFNRAFYEADFSRSATMAYIVTSQPEPGQSFQSRTEAWKREMATISQMIGLATYEDASLPGSLIWQTEEQRLNFFREMDGLCQI